MPGISDREPHFEEEYFVGGNTCAAAWIRPDKPGEAPDPVPERRAGFE